MTNAVAEIKFLNIPVLKIRDYRNRFYKILDCLKIQYFIKSVPGHRFYETWIVNFCTRRFYKIPDFIKSASQILNSGGCWDIYLILDMGRTS